MILQNLKSNTEEWLAHRRLYNNASEASIMMGASKNVTRNELLHAKSTGLDRDFSEWFQKNVLDYGHDVEAAARPIAEKIAGEALYPVSATDDANWLAASYDGMTMMEVVNWECKQWNKGKAADVEAGKVPDCDYWQVVQQLVINEGSKTLYMVTDGTEERTVYLWVELNPADAKKLKAGWIQFEKDLAEYVPTEKAVDVAGDKPDSLPALNIVVEGAVTTSNLPAYKERALAMIAGVKTDLRTDKDFLDAAELIKAFKSGEDELESAKKRALSQTASIEELFRTVDDVKEKMRSKRLELNKLVESQKDARKLEILAAAKSSYSKFYVALESSLEDQAGGLAITLREDNGPDFGGAMKGKRTISSLRSACDDTLANAKIELTEIADGIRVNIRQLNEHAGEYAYLFSDFGRICQKPAEDFAAIVKSRIAEHKEAEQARLDAHREQIRREEEAKAQTKLDAERQAQHEAEQQALRNQQQASEASRMLQADNAKESAPEPTRNVKPAWEYEAPAHTSKAAPSLSEIIGVLSSHYGVDRATAALWLTDIRNQEQAA